MRKGGGARRAEKKLKAPASDLSFREKGATKQPGRGSQGKVYWYEKKKKRRKERMTAKDLIARGGFGESGGEGRNPRLYSVQI